MLVFFIIAAIVLGIGNASACVNSPYDSGDISISLKRSGVKQDHCISMVLKYPARVRNGNKNSQLKISQLRLVGDGFESYLSLQFSHDDISSSYFCLSEELLEKSYILLFYGAPENKISNTFNSCIFPPIKIDKLDQLLK